MHHSIQSINFSFSDNAGNLNGFSYVLLIRNNWRQLNFTRITLRSRHNYLNYIIMFICIDKTKTIHHFYCYFVEKVTDFSGISVESL